MALSELTARLLARPTAYRLWQSPFAARKLYPILRHNDVASVRRVLDVGCGPGTNAAYFAHTDYLGIDLNPRYIEFARRHYAGNFAVADATTFQGAVERPFDFILLNSLLHHIDDEGVTRILSSLRTLLAVGGSIHILDLVLPARRSVARVLARLDRGQFARASSRWQELFGASFEAVIFEPYLLSAMGIGLWNMVYFKGTARA
jgi:SAM-dependent methyltransferase